MTVATSPTFVKVLDVSKFHESKPSAGKRLKKFLKKVSGSSKKKTKSDTKKIAALRKFFKRVAKATTKSFSDIVTVGSKEGASPRGSFRGGIQLSASADTAQTAAETVSREVVLQMEEHDLTARSYTDLQSVASEEHLTISEFLADGDETLQPASYHHVNSDYVGIAMVGLMTVLLGVSNV